jgi:serine/threonine protein kinase
LSLQSTKYESFEDILISNNIFNNIKTFEKLIEFKDSFVKNGFYSKNFEEIKKLGFGSFGIAFKAKKNDWNYFCAIKKIRFNIKNKNEIIREYLNYKIITRNYSENEYLVEHFNAWFEESVVSNKSGISLYIEMELCDKTLEDVINELTNDSILKNIESLTTIGYYIASQIFIEILEGINHLHKQILPLIHRDLKPANILLKKFDQKGFVSKSPTLDLWLFISFQNNRMLEIRERLNIRHHKLSIIRNMTQRQTFIA